MTRNNLKIAVRVLWRDKFNSSINLLGLTLGITCFLLLGLYVKQELSYDHFHGKKERIYRTWLKEDYGEGREFFNSHTPLRFESILEDNFPEVEKSVQYIQRRYLVGRDENRINEQVSVISPDFFEVFDFKLLYGSAQSPLPTRNDIAISESYAKKYFGERDALGKTIAVQIDTVVIDFTVSSVFQNIPQESSIQFDLAISTDNNRRIFNERAFTAWFNIIAETYVLFRENTQVSSVDDKMQDVVMSLMGDATYGNKSIERDQYNIGFQPLTDIHLNPDIPLGYAPVSNPQYVMILGAIGLLVLIMACVNYTSLSVGQSLKRSKEVGMRKVLGAAKGTLVYQYLSESLLLAIVAIIFSTVLTILLIPIFNTLTGTEIFFQFEWWHIGIYLAIGLVIGFVAGTYPAFVTSAFKTIDIVSGGPKSAGRLIARKGLVVIQFLVTVFLISTVLIMTDQVNFLMEKDLGFEHKAFVSARLPTDPGSRGIRDAINSGMDNGELLRVQLEKYPEITNVAMGSHVFGSNGWAHLAFNDDKGDFKWFRLLVVNTRYLPAFNIQIKKGRGFELDNGLDKRQSVIINEAAAKSFGLENPVGSKLPGAEFGEHQIIGVVENFHYSSLHTEIEPLVIVQNVMPIFQGVSDVDITDSPRPKIVFTYTGNHLPEAIDILEKEWELAFSDEALNYSFVEENIRAQYENEARLNKLIFIATILSIIIASLGLFGLIMLMANGRLKEIGIRKVMGATPRSIFNLLVRGFVIQLFVAILLSIPLTVTLMNQWLENFAYRVNISALPFIMSGMAILLIAGVVIAYHALRTSRVNPIESLRVE